MQSPLPKIKKHLDKQRTEEAVNLLSDYVKTLSKNLKFNEYLDFCNATLEKVNKDYKSQHQEIESGNLDDNTIKIKKSELNAQVDQVLKEKEIMINMSSLELQVEESKSLELEVDYDEFSKEDYLNFQKIIKKIIPDQNFRINGVKRGSVKILIEVSEEDMKKLIAAMHDSELLAEHGLGKIVLRSVENKVTNEDPLDVLIERINFFESKKTSTSDAGKLFEIEKELEKMQKERRILRKRRGLVD